MQLFGASGTGASLADAARQWAKAVRRMNDSTSVAAKPMSTVTHPAPLTTHDETKGLTSLRLSRAQRMGWARSILADLKIHSNARSRRACLAILNHAGSDDHAH